MSSTALRARLGSLAPATVRLDGVAGAPGGARAGHRAGLEHRQRRVLARRGGVLHAHGREDRAERVQPLRVPAPFGPPGERHQRGFRGRVRAGDRRGVHARHHQRGDLRAGLLRALHHRPDELGQLGHGGAVLGRELAVGEEALDVQVDAVADALRELEHRRPPWPSRRWRPRCPRPTRSASPARRASRSADAHLRNSPRRVGAGRQRGRGRAAAPAAARPPRCRPRAGATSRRARARAAGRFAAGVVAVGLEAADAAGGHEPNLGHRRAKATGPWHNCVGRYHLMA